MCTPFSSPPPHPSLWAISAEEVEDHIQAAAAWALGQIGRHTPEHAKAVAQVNVLPKLLQCYLRAGESFDFASHYVFINVITDVVIVVVVIIFVTR